MSSRILLLLLALVLIPSEVMGQGTVRGTVTTPDGLPLPGANVAVAETTLGSITSTDGTYRIEGVPAGTRTITATFVGFQPQSRTVAVVDGETVVADFTLREGVELEQVVVEGYRVRRVPIESGAISTVDAAQLEGLTVRSPDQALQGRASGVRVTARSGQPGAGVEIQVRGAGSINAGSDPLFVVDGVQVTRNDQLFLASGNPLTAISPEDIESIEILKDAAAASIYGAQAANGVVIITTRRGRVGATEVTFESQLGSVGPISDFRVMNAEEYSRNRVTAFLNQRARLAATGVPSAADTAAAFNRYGMPDTLGVGTNWQDAVFRSGMTQSYNLSFRGGSDQTTFFVSGRFANDEGQIIASNFRQFGLRLNLDHRVTDNLNLESRISLSNSNVRGTISDGPYINSPFFAAQFLSPLASIYNEPGNPDSGFNLTPPSPFTYNPVAQETWDIRTSSVVAVIASGAVNYEIMPGLFSRTFGGIKFDDSDEFQYRDPRQPPNAGVGGTGAVYASRTADFNLSQTFSYSHLLADMHRLSGMVGTEFKRGTDAWHTAVAQGFPNHLFNALSTAASYTSITETSTEYRQLSFFGDAEYTYDNAYQLRGVLRYDGSSRFGEDRRFGLFGTLAGYVRPLRTGLLPEIDALSELRLRASFGRTGNSEIGNFAARRLFTGAGDYANRPGLRPSSLGNNLLTWESSVEANLGLDVGVLSNRIMFSANMYQQDRNDLLLARDLPVDSGFASLVDNVGSVRAQGLELDLNTLNVDMGGFQWSTNFNITFQRMEVMNLVGDDEEVVVGGYVYRVGEAPRQYRMNLWAGVNPATGRAMHYDQDGNLTYFPGTDDMALVGSPDPDFFGGLGNTLSYAGVTLDAFFQFDYGRTTFNNDRWFSDYSHFSYNKAVRVIDHWSQPGDMAVNPIPYYGATWPDGSTEGIFESSRFIEDASYIRLKQLRLSYAVPTSVLQQAGLRTGTVFVQGENLATWTAFTGIDPEVVGTALGRYPQARVFTAGFRVGL
jgi:TonB-dependent starch-binding outer membrane protein SusC